MSPRQALHAATMAPTRFFNNSHEMGQIQAGMVADLVLLKANPLENISNTRQIAAVMSRGVWARR